MKKIERTLSHLILWCIIIYTSAEEATLESETIYGHPYDIDNFNSSIVLSMYQNINKTKTNLINAANGITRVIANMSLALQSVSKITSNTISSTSVAEWLNDVEIAVNKTLKSTDPDMVNIECIRENENEAHRIATSAMESVRVCTLPLIENISKLIKRSSRLSGGAINFAVILSDLVYSCVLNVETRTPTDVEHAELCLTSIVGHYTLEAGDLVNEISIQIIENSQNLEVLPMRFSICSDGAIANAISQIGVIVMSIPECVKISY